MRAGSKRQAISRIYLLYRFFWNAVDWIYPPECAGCKKHGFRWCPECQELVPKPDLMCPMCAEPNQTGILCIKCQAAPPAYNSLRSWGYYREPLRSAILQLKYKRNLGLGDPFSFHLEEVLKREKWEVDLICPVPLSTSRRQDRGYNQCEVIAQPLAWRLNIPYQTKALIRHRETRSQVGLSLKERKENVRDAFSVHKEVVRGKNIVVIDDVATTGSTLESCSQALRIAGANNIYCLTLARAGGPDDDLLQAPSTVGDQNS